MIETENDIVMTMRGYQRSQRRLESLRIEEIRESDVVRAIPIFNTAFRMAIRDQIKVRPTPLSKTMRAYLGVDR